MPLVQLDFPNPLNTSVQIGDTAYFSNPIEYGTTGNPLSGNQWESTTTPHLTSDQHGIMMIGIITEIITWDGTVSSIICDMPQNLFNQYFSDIQQGGCTTINLISSPNCGSKTLVTYSDLLANSTGFVDSLYGGNWWGGTTAPANYDGPQIYSMQRGRFPTVGNDDPGWSGEFGTMILHWFWDNPNGQNLTFSNYAFEHWHGGVYYVDYFDFYNQFNYAGQVQMNFNNVLDIISWWQAELATYEPTSTSSIQFTGPPSNPTGIYATGSTSSPKDPSTTAGVYNNSVPTGPLPHNYPRQANHLAVVPGCSFDDYYNRLPRGYGNNNTVAYAFCRASWCDEHVHQCTGVTTNCNTGSFIMFSKDNKVNLSSVLGYYASATFRNDSTEKAELFNVGADVFESSK